MLTQPAFGRHLRELRRARMLTLVELAPLVGTSWQQVRKWEVGQAMPRPSFQRKLCEALGVSADELLGIDARGKDEG